MDRRVAKQLIIALVVMLLFVGAGFAVFAVLVYEAPSCSDGVRNQNEVGVDCGGVCSSCIGLPQALRLRGEAVFVSGDRESADAAFRIENINPQWGATAVPYTVTLEDASGESVASASGTTFVLPFETRLVVEQAIALTRGGSPVRVRVDLDTPAWVEVPDEVRDDQLVVTDATFRRFAQGPDLAEARGVVRNDSSFTYDRIEVHVEVTDGTGAIVGLRRTEMRTLTPGERREFRVAWRVPLATKGEPRLEIVAATNVFQNENFVRLHGTTERFQELR